jgi:hypothetical protein
MNIAWVLDWFVWVCLFKLAVPCCRDGVVVQSHAAQLKAHFGSDAHAVCAVLGKRMAPFFAQFLWGKN